MKLRERVLFLLSIANRRLSGAEISKVTGAWSGTLFIALYSLEAAGKIESNWIIEKEHPRRRVYGLPKESK